MSDKVNEHLHNLLDACLEAQQCGVDCFFEYSPHVQLIRVDIYERGWRFRQGKDASIEIYLDFAFAENKLSQLISQIETLIKKQKEEQLNDRENINQEYEP